MIFMRFRLWTLLLITVSLSLGSCSGLVPVSITETPLPSATLTPTILWFPATNTPASLPSPTNFPTPERAPGLADLLFSDTFGTPELWNTTTSSVASVAVTRNRLILSVNGQGPQSIISLRTEPVLGDFYAEVQADLSLCRAADRYGLVFHATPDGDYYRFAINCDGQLRLERGRGGSVAPLTDWLSSVDASFGAPASLKLGVWMAGSEIRLYLNDRFQLAFRDPTLRTGTIGFFAYANGTTPITVAFSNLQVYSIFYVSPTPSPTASLTPTPTR